MNTKSQLPLETPPKPNSPTKSHQKPNHEHPGSKINSADASHSNRKGNSDSDALLSIGSRVLARRKTKRLKKLSAKKQQSRSNRTPFETPNQLIQIRKLKLCKSPTQLQQLLVRLTPRWRNILKFYMTECFIFDFHAQSWQKNKLLLSKRDLFYNAIDDPALLLRPAKFGSDFVPLYCTRIADFVTAHHHDICTVLEKRSRS